MAFDLRQLGFAYLPLSAATKFVFPTEVMKPAPFKYIAARSLEQALALKAEFGDEANFLAGGQSLMPTLNFRLSQPAVLIDINPLKECAGSRQGGPDSPPHRRPNAVSRH